MLIFNLKENMKKNNTTITQIYKATGISRNTLNQMYNNKSKGIQLDTLEKLINYFDISINQFIVKDSNRCKITFDYSSKPKVVIAKARNQATAFDQPIKFVSQIDNKEKFKCDASVSCGYMNLDTVHMIGMRIDINTKSDEEINNVISSLDYYSEIEKEVLCITNAKKIMNIFQKELEDNYFNDKAFISFSMGLSSDIGTQYEYSWALDVVTSKHPEKIIRHFHKIDQSN